MFLRAVTLLFCVASVAILGRFADGDNDVPRDEIPPFKPSHVGRFALRSQKTFDLVEALANEVIREHLFDQALPPIEHGGIPFLPERVPSSTTCEQCMHKVISQILSRAADRISEFCSSTADLDAYCLCKGLAEHIDFLRGVLYQKLRPSGLSFFFCTGPEREGPCKVDGDVDAELYNHLPANVDVSPISASLVGRVEEFFSSGFGSFAEGAAKCETCDSSDDQELLSFNSCTCQRCIQHTTRLTLEAQIERLGFACLKANLGDSGPKFQQLCEIAVENAELATGYLTALVQPWRTAEGFCIGKLKCPMRRGEPQTDDDFLARMAPAARGKYLLRRIPPGKPFYLGGAMVAAPVLEKIDNMADLSEKLHK